MADIEQGTDAWLALRMGKVTASRIKDVMATVKSGESASRRNYRAQLVAERLTGRPAESFTNAAMQWGTEHEPIARGLYEIRTGRDVSQVAFVDHPTIAMAGASPDGLVLEDGLIEIKAPNTATHIDYLLAGEPPSDYKLQMLFQMMCTGRRWCDFVSYEPRLPDNLQLFLVRYHYDEARAAEVSAEVVKFLAEVAETVAKLERIGK